MTSPARFQAGIHILAEMTLAILRKQAEAGALALETIDPSTVIIAQSPALVENSQ